jgi:hypothetical protein
VHCLLFCRTEVKPFQTKNKFRPTSIVLIFNLQVFFLFIYLFYQDGCIKCFAPPICPPCTKLEKCEITPASCDDCGSGKCVPL